MPHFQVPSQYHHANSSGDQKVFMTPNMITNIHFLLIVSQFNSSFTDKQFINNFINQVIDYVSN
jgi:hypothetical protein